VRHGVRLRGHAFGLRPVETADAAFIVELRTNPELSRWIGDTPSDVGAEEAWLARYFARPDDYYFIVEGLGGAPEGTVGIYDVDATRRAAEWGRWVLRPGSLAAAESAWLTYRVAFEILGLDLVYCRTVIANARTVSFQASCGLVEHTRLPGHAVIGGVPYDVVEHHLTRARWPECEATLARTAERIGRLILRDAAR